MDQQKTWFALNDELCVIPPRKLCSNGKFDMFPEEVCRVNIGDLQDKNGGFVHFSWFNKGAKAADTLYADTFFRFTRWKSAPQKSWRRRIFQIRYFPAFEKDSKQ